MSEISGFEPHQSHRRAHASVGVDPILLSIGDSIRASRVEAGMTQEELALVTGIGRDRIMQIENGKSGVSIGAVSQVLKALGLKLMVTDN